MIFVSIHRLYYETSVVRSLWSHYKGGRWEALRLLLHLSSETRGSQRITFAGQVEISQGENRGEIIGSANFVLLIAAWTDVSILIERIDSDA